MISVSHLSKIYRTNVKQEGFIKSLMSRKYEEKRAVDDISFEIGEHELVGFIGPNGAGKTTTMKILSGILYPTEGSVKVLGYTPFEKDYRLLKRIAFVMGQKNQMLWELPALDSFKLYKEIFELSDTQYQETVTELLDLLDAHDLVKQPVKTLSLGQRMRVELISSLLHRPKILFLDEPTIGLDIFAQTTIRNFIKEYQTRHRATIVLTSHYMQDVEKLADRVILIDNGRIIFDDKLNRLTDEYSDEKRVTLTVERELTPKDIDALRGIPYQYTFPQLEFRIERKNLSDALSVILKKIPFDDLSVEDDPLEDIVKKIFTKKKR
jgi:ABC-2 type transport system ATP-binding protein